MVQSAIAAAVTIALLLLERRTVAVTAFLLVALGMAKLSSRAPGAYDTWLLAPRDGSSPSDILHAS